MSKFIALKIDVDTERGTREGVPALQRLLNARNIQGTFYFSLGPDKTGRAIKRIFRPGFFEKVNRTSVVKVYGIKTLLNGVILPGPHIGKRHADLMRNVLNEGHEVGVHCYDHIAWQDNVQKWPETRVREEVNKAANIFSDIFKTRPLTMAAAGWQANKASLSAYDDHTLLYASDSRGAQAFYPKMGHKQFSTLQIPTTLPTLDELYGRPEYPLESLVDHYVNWIEENNLNVFTLHAELEGMAFKGWFETFLDALIAKGYTFGPLKKCYNLLKDSKDIPILPLVQGTIEGRSGFLAKHA